MSTVTVVKKRVSKKIPSVIRNNLTTDEKKAIITIIATHKKKIKNAEKEAVKAEKEAVKAEKEAAKAAKLQAKLQAKAAKLQAKEDAKAAKLQAKEDAKAAKLQAKKDAKAAKKEATKKAKKDNNEKRKPTAYAIFMKSVRSSIKNDNPDASFGEISKIVGEKWKMLSDDEKNQYKVE